MIKFTQGFIILLFTYQIWCDECVDPPDFKEITKCCTIPILIKMDLHETCAKEINLKPEINYDAAIECKMSECVFKKTNAIVDDKPSAPELKKFVKSMLDENPGWENVFNAATDKCVPLVIAQEAETKKRASGPPFNVEKSINPIYAHLLACIGTELILECPEKARGDGVKCEAVKTNLKKCSKEFPPRYLAD